jgi:iron complex outermembrane recepter protein
MRHHTLFLSAVALSASSVASAQSSGSENAQTDDFHTTSDDIVVTAPFTRSLDLFGNVGVLESDEIVANIRPQIGDVLASQPGVSATSFTPGASRPVVRGFQGERVRVLVDGIGSIDVSNTSADHGVTVDPLTAERIEILRGPASLLFGSNAIGGAINIFDRRIPRGVPEEPVHFDGVGSIGSAANDYMVGGSLDMPVAQNMVVHADGSYTRSTDLRVGGRPFAGASRNRIENSAVETLAAGTGLAVVNDGGSLGASIGYYESTYGIPVRPGGEDELVSLGVEQWRADVRGQVNIASGLFDRLRIRAGFADYRHTEFEGDEVGTVFLNQGLEARAELVQRERNGWRGATGVQYSYRDFNAIGEEAFVPQNDTTQFALFTLQELRTGSIDIEVAGRWERSLVMANSVGVRREFSALSGAIGFSYEFGDRSKIGINFSRSARAPSAEELLSDGPHVATQAYEIGNPDFQIERAWGVELVGRLQTGSLTVNASAYHSWFSNFIFEEATGAVLDDLPVFQYRQADVRYYGFEIDAAVRLGYVGPFALNGDLVADVVHARLDGGGTLPRIPPLRLRGGVELEASRLTIRGEAEHAFSQDRVTGFETPTRAYTLVNASIEWRPFAGQNVSLLLSANNIFDVLARRHASFTKDFVPLAGRDIRISARFSF